jgi:glutamine amidotransferase
MSEVPNQVSDDARIVPSEPVGDLPGAWNEVPEATYCMAAKGDDQLRPFDVEPRTTTVPVST